MRAGLEFDGFGPGGLTVDARLLATQTGTARVEQLSTSLQWLLGYALWFR